VATILSWSRVAGERLEPLLARRLIILLFVAPAAVAGYSATHGIAQMAMPSPTWQTIFAVIGAIAVSVTAFVRFTGMAAPGPAGQGLARG